MTAVGVTCVLGTAAGVTTAGVATAGVTTTGVTATGVTATGVIRAVVTCIGVVCDVFASVADVVALTTATPPITRPRDSVLTINVCLILNIKIILPIIFKYIKSSVARFI